MEAQKPLQTETRLKTEWHIARRTSPIGFRIGLIALVGLLTGALPRGQTNNAPDGRDNRDVRYTAYDELLDLNVRDGMVYYRISKHSVRASMHTSAGWPRHRSHPSGRRHRSPSGSTPTMPSSCRRSSITIPLRNRHAPILREASGRFQEHSSGRRIVSPGER